MNIYALAAICSVGRHLLIFMWLIGESYRLLIRSVSKHASSAATRTKGTELAIFEFHARPHSHSRPSMHAACCISAHTTCAIFFLATAWCALVLTVASFFSCYEFLNCFSKKNMNPQLLPMESIQTLTMKSKTILYTIHPWYVEETFQTWASHFSSFFFSRNQTWGARVNATQVPKRWLNVVCCLF